MAMSLPVQSTPTEPTSRLSPQAARVTATAAVMAMAARRFMGGLPGCGERWVVPRLAARAIASLPLEGRDRGWGVGACETSMPDETSTPPPQLCQGPAGQATLPSPQGGGWARALNPASSVALLLQIPLQQAHQQGERNGHGEVEEGHDIVGFEEQECAVGIHLAEMGNVLHAQRRDQRGMCDPRDEV